MKFSEIKEHTAFKEGQRISCVANDRGEHRPTVHLTNNKIYTVISVEFRKGNKWTRDCCDVWVKNDDGIIEKYSSKRFKIDRESIISELLD